MNALKHTMCWKIHSSNVIYEENCAKEDEFTHLFIIKDYWYKDSNVSSLW